MTDTIQQSKAASIPAPRSLAHNTLSNLLGQSTVVVVAFAATPIIVNGLGMERFGLLAILWGMVGYFGFLDLGTGQAAVKYLAEALEQKDHDGARAILRAAIISNGALAAVGTLLIAGLALGGFVAVLNIRPELEGEATLCFYLAAACVVPMLLQTALRSVPIAVRRFDIVNAVQAGTGLMQWGGSALLIVLGAGLPAILILTVVTKCASLLVFALTAGRLLPGSLRIRSTSWRRGVGKLLRFGVWVTPSQLIPPAVSLAEKMMIGNLVALGWVTYFAIPSDAALRVLIFPVSLVNAFFPVLSGGWSIHANRSEVAGLYHRAFKLLFLLLLPVMIAGILFADEILTVWLGRAFADRSATTLALLVCATFMMALAQLPNAALQALGRPDLPAKLLFIETPVFLGLSFYLTRSFGIQGTACSVLLRCAIEFAVLSVLTTGIMRSANVPWRVDFAWKGGGAALVALALAGIAKWTVRDAFVQTGIEAAVWLGCALALWYYVMENEDRELILQKITVFLPRRRGQT